MTTTRLDVDELSVLAIHTIIADIIY
uniref:Uncharacterized protein n=1 Tax=Ralstonia solanacearum TaxID=305 RepID=A0A0S4V3Q1_RALSL|nr:protein of unknown function [Ralstonia solanacearum]